MRTLQGLINRVLLPVSRYREYQQKTFGYDGYYRFMGRCTGFRGTDGTMTYSW